MSGITGIYNRDGRPADDVMLRRMIDVAVHRGPDGIRTWRDGPVALGHLMLRTTPEALHEQQPLLDESGLSCLVLDGRVDNREELKDALESRGAVLRTDTDAELVLRAYQIWGEQSPRWIVGDFAFVIWDSRREMLFCARDVLGIKPLYYCIDGHRFAFGSELRQVVESGAVRREPNEQMIAEFLTASITNTEETLFRNVLRLPAGHTLSVTATRVRKGRPWDVNPGQTVRYRRDGEYAEHFYHLFEQAVRCRMRSPGSVGAHLSGGVDSSSVISLAERLRRAGDVSLPRLETYSLVYPGRACDESRYIDDVVRMWDVPSHRFEPEEARSSYYVDQVRETYDFPDFPNQSNLVALTADASSHGHRVLLTGQGGDDWMTGSLYHYADLLRHLRLKAFLREVREGSTGITFTLPRQRILRYGVAPLLPAGVLRALQRVRGRSAVPFWIAPRFAQKTGLAERLGWEAPVPPFPTLAQREIYRGNLFGGTQVRATEMRDRFNARQAIEDRHPLNDRRLFQFLIALPEDQFWRGGTTKVILRNALRGVLPESVRVRRDKAEFGHHFAESFRIQGGMSLFSSLSIASLGWVDQKCVTDMYADLEWKYKHGDYAYGAYLFPLWMIYGIELWYNTMFGSGSQPTQICN